MATTGKFKFQFQKWCNYITDWQIAIYSNSQVSIPKVVQLYQVH